MALELQLTEEQTKKVKARAAELGYSSIESYVRSLIEADTEEQELPEEIEAQLLEALKSPLREMRPADWDEMRRRLIEQHQRKAG
jgi:hypothetical protein